MEDWVLRDVSFRVEPGQTIAIVGHTGAGKTTLISLCCAFTTFSADNPPGRQGHSTDRMQDCGGQFGIVLQDHFFSLHELKRISGSAPAASTAPQSNAPSRRLGLENSFAPAGGVGASVNERGSTLSVGQAPAHQFLRAALAHNPRFLILDEATSSVDTDGAASFAKP